VSVSTAKPAFQQRLFRTRPDDTLPLSIEHQRIYILPTRRGIAFLISLLIMLIASVNYALSLGYALCFLLTGLFAASLLHTYKNVAGITINKITVNNVFAGDLVQFRLNVENTSQLNRIGVMLKTPETKDTIDIAALSDSNATLSTTALNRGKYFLGRVTITSTYPLGLWRTWCYIHTSANAIVYPTPESAPPPLPTELVDSNGEQFKKSQQGDIAGVREYHTGDSIASIAWKAAARGQGLYVKTFEQDSVGGDVDLTLASTGENETEKQLSRLTAWVLAAENMQSHYAMQLPEIKLASNQGPEHKKQALVALALHGHKQ